MANFLRDRIIGVETEFGCLVHDEEVGTPEQVVEAIKNQVFFDQKIGLIDLHARDEVFEPARSGGFLINGGRLYIDAVGSHLEYATAETLNLKDLIANDRAGHRIIVRALRELGIEDQVSIYNNSVDHFGGHTFGCHENYLTQMDEDFFSNKLPRLYAFLVTRQIFAGVGRVGGHILTDDGGRPEYEDVMANPIDYIWVSNIYGVQPDPSISFQLSQRADHILKPVASRVRFNRALVNPKWEHFYSHENLQRLHVLYGESNMMEYAYALKVGTTNLALRLLEEDALFDEITLMRPLNALRSISRDQSYKWIVPAGDGSPTTALEVQKQYLDRCTKYAGESEETDWILNEWAKTLDQLVKDPMQLSDRLDWVAKKKIIDEYIAEEGLEPGDDALHSVDMEYHNINPDQGLFHALQSMGQTVRMIDDLDAMDAMTDPPQNTRAKGRGGLIKQLLTGPKPRYYGVDWSGVTMGHRDHRDLSDPYDTYEDA